MQHRRPRGVASYVIMLLSFLFMEQTMAQDSLPPGRGGNGGSARVEGNGLAIGGPGGRVSGDARGVRGGDGGGEGSVGGDVVVGGGGGHVAGPEYGCRLHGQVMKCTSAHLDSRLTHIWRSSVAVGQWPVTMKS
jgi:hypothetical protein